MEAQLFRAGLHCGSFRLGNERPVWEVAEGIATTFMCAVMAARARMLEHASPLVRLLRQRGALYQDASFHDL